MTKDELEELVLKSKEPAKIARAFSQLDEKQRKALSTHAQRLLKQLESGTLNKTASLRLEKHIKARKGESWSHWHKPDSVNARLAVLAVGPLSAVKKLRLFWRDETGQAINKILTDRKPDWIDEWIEFDLELEFSSLDFGVLWEWMKQGLCRQPCGDGFYEKFAHYMQSTGTYGRGPGVPISKALNAEPKLKEYVWSLFKIESNAFNTNSWLKKGAADDYETWTEALIKMSEAGDLDRQRLLDSSLEGLWQDLKQNQLSGFHKFHKGLKPTPEEQFARQKEYLSLLSHSIGHVVKFGLDNTNALEKSRELDTDLFLAEVSNVFFQEAKGNAVFAVKLMARLLKSQPENAQQILTVLPDALRHSHPDVQNLALDLFAKNADKIDDNIRQGIADAANFVSASVRLQLEPYLATDAAEVILKDVEPEPIIDLTHLTARQKKALRINELSKDGPFEYWPISQNILEHDVLPELEKLDPITTEDDLIAAIAHAIEVVDGPDEIERIVDGISRLAGTQSDDFAAKSAPLLTRLEKKMQSGGEKGLRYHGNASAAVMDLVYTWLTQKYHRLPQKKFEKHVTAFIPAALYFREVTARVHKGQSRTLLTLPTHKGGWIEPLVWVKRLQSFQDKNIKLSEYEVSLSVLRLAPDNRAKASKVAAKLEGGIGRLARFALGGDDRPVSKDKKQYGMWVSAARCRDPYGDLSTYLSELKLKDQWPDGVNSAVYRWRAFIESKDSGFSKETYHFPKLEFSISIKGKTNGFEAKKPSIVPRLKNPLSTEWERLPTAAANCRTRQRYYWGSELNAVYLSKWLCYQWPQCPNAAFMTGVENLMQRIDENSSSWDPNFGYLEGLFHKNRPWLENGHLLLCVALAGKDADVRGLAIDAMIEGIENGTFDIDICSSVLSKLAESGWLKLNRLGDNLMVVAETSRFHAWVVSALIQRWIWQVDLKQRYIFRMFEVLLEAQSAIGLGLHSNTRSALSVLKGSGKATKMAKTLSKIEDGSSNMSAELKNAAIAGRL